MCGGLVCIELVWQPLGLSLLEEQGAVGKVLSRQLKGDRSIVNKPILLKLHILHLTDCRMFSCKNDVPCEFVCPQARHVIQLYLMCVYLKSLKPVCFIKQCNCSC